MPVYWGLRNTGEMEDGKGEHRQLDRGSLFHALGSRSLIPSFWQPLQKQLVTEERRKSEGQIKV